MESVTDVATATPPMCVTAAAVNCTATVTTATATTTVTTILLP